VLQCVAADCVESGYSYLNTITGTTTTSTGGDTVPAPDVLAADAARTSDSSPGHQTHCCRGPHYLVVISCLVRAQRGEKRRVGGGVLEQCHAGTRWAHGYEVQCTQ